MKLKALKLATFKHATLTTLQQAVNDFTAGKAVSSGSSGTNAYAADEVGERIYVAVQTHAEDSGGTPTYTAFLWYTQS